MKLTDTSVLIEHLRGRRAIATVLGGQQPVASVLSRIEIEGKMRSHERTRVRQLMNTIRMHPVTDQIAIRAGEFNRRYRDSHHTIDLVDYVIAATADVLGAELLTLNVKHFPMFEGLEPAF